MGYRKITEETVARIEELIRQGVRAPDIAREVGVGRTTVTRIEHRLNVFFPPGPPANHPWRTDRVCVRPYQTQETPGKTN